MSRAMTDAPARNLGSPEIGSPALWIGFSAFVVAALLLDFLVFHRKSHEVRTRQALAWVGLWVSLAMVLVLVLRLQFGSEPSLQFLAGYLLEYALSVDNLFVFLVIFTYFKVPAVAKDRVLFLGILGSILLRGIFILVGSALIHRFHFILYLFGAFLVFTGLKLLFQKGDEEVAIEHSPVIRMFRRFVPMVSAYHGDKFFIRDEQELRATPLLLVVAVLGFTDVIFATDSIPAIFGVTQDLLRGLDDDDQVPPAQVRARAHPGLHRRQDADRRSLCLPFRQRPRHRPSAQDSHRSRPRSRRRSARAFGHRFAHLPRSRGAQALVGPGQPRAACGPADCVLRRRWAK